MKKLKNQKGFTMTEMLACVVTLLLLVGICTVGTNLAMDSYNKSTFESHSQMLESTLDMHLGDIIRHATIEWDETQPLEGGKYKIKSITNLLSGINQGMIGISDDGRFYIYKTPADTTGASLLSDSVYTKTIHIKDFSLEFYKDEEGQYVTGSYIIESTVVDDVEKKCEFTYRIATIY